MDNEINSQEAMEILQILFNKFDSYPGYYQALDLGIKALGERAKRLRLIEENRLLYGKWEDNVFYTCYKVLEECEIDD